MIKFEAQLSGDSKDEEFELTGYLGIELLHSRLEHAACQRAGIRYLSDKAFVVTCFDLDHGIDAVKGVSDWLTLKGVTGYMGSVFVKGKTYLIMENDSFVRVLKGFDMRVPSPEKGTCPHCGKVFPKGTGKPWVICCGEPLDMPETNRITTKKDLH